MISKKIILILLFTLIFSNSFSQKKNKHFFNTVIFGSSLTYLLLDNSNYDSFQEFTWHVNGAISLHKQVFVGTQVLTIFYKNTNPGWENYYIYGLFGQFDFMPKQKFRLFIETSINKGNYCICWNEPYLKNNLFYLGFGFGCDIPIKFLSDKLFLDLSFYNYAILNKIEEKSNYTQYIIGINYHFGKKIK